MQATLKQARRIESTIQKALEEASRFFRAEPEQAFANRTEALAWLEDTKEEVLDRVIGMVDAQNEIRDAIRLANESSNINQKIQAISDRERMIYHLENLNSMSRLTAEYGKRDSHTGRRDEAKVEFNLDKELTALRFEVSSLKDSVNGSNATITVELSGAVQQVAEDLGIPV